MLTLGRSGQIAAVAVAIVSLRAGVAYLVVVRAIRRQASMLAVLITVLLPPAASASSFSVIPPSNSSADQYVESVPTAAGNRSSTPIVAPGSTVESSTRPDASIPASTQAELVRSGADGRRAAALAARFTPVQARNRPSVHGRSRLGRRSAGGAPGAGAASGGSSGGGSSPLGTLVRALVGSGTPGTSGALVPIALVLSTLGVAAVALRRRSG
jgi:hypothetical protein